MKGQQAIYQRIQSAANSGNKQFAVLVDPDKSTPDQLLELIRRATLAGVDYFFVGGSLLNGGQLDATVSIIREHSQIPVVLFPGSPLQITKHADALLFLSLISGRNADLLIGQHVIAAPYLRSLQLEVLSTGYMLVDCGRQTTASYISNTQPLPYDKPDIAACTALAGEYLGMKLIYLDGGSGALQPLSEEMISAVKKNISVPLIVGGGINNAALAEKAYRAGADVLVVGNAIEKDPELISSIAAIKHSFKGNGVLP